jgi:hypothetical protein
MRGSADETEQLPDGVKDRAWCHRRQLSLNGKPKSLAAVARRESWLADRHPAPERQGTEEAAFFRAGEPVWAASERKRLRSSGKKYAYL